jgi:hypothetical protein
LKAEHDGQRMDRKTVSEKAKHPDQHNAHDQYSDHDRIYPISTL